jgi:predicted dehydrogenase
MRTLKFAVIGGGFMGKAYSIALANLPMYVWPCPVAPVRELVAEATPELAEEARERFGYARSTADWRQAVNDPAIDVVVVLTPNHLHREMVLEAVAAGKHVICEKPLAPNADDAEEMLRAADRAGVVHQVGFNWRLTPAVQQAKRMIDDGTIGEPRDFRGHWLGDFAFDDSLPMLWRFKRATAGSGALGDLGSHVVDFARCLVGEIAAVSGIDATYTRTRLDANGKPDEVDVDDATAFLARFAGGAHGFLESSWAAPGRKSFAGFELHGSRGSLAFDWERMNELRFYDAGDPGDRQGFRTILVGPEQPGGQHFWPIAGYQIGYADTKLLQILDFVEAIVEGRAPQTTFADGLAAVRLEEAVIESCRSVVWVTVEGATDSPPTKVSQGR